MTCEPAHATPLATATNFDPPKATDAQLEHPEPVLIPVALPKVALVQVIAPGAKASACKLKGKKDKNNENTIRIDFMRKIDLKFLAHNK